MGCCISAHEIHSSPTDTRHSEDGHQAKASTYDNEHVLTCFHLATKGSNAFRILLVGKSGSGKSTLVKEVFDFDVTAESVSHFSVGEHDINQPILSANNKALILHDSKGLEAGSEGNLTIISQFVENRKDRSFDEQLHGIWYCIEIPVGGERVFEGGDVKLLELMKQSSNNIPIIVVFTKLDRLQFHEKRRLKKEYVQKGLSAQDAAARAEVEYINSSKEKYTNSCIKILESISVLKDWAKYTFVSSKQLPTIVNLIELTASMLNETESLRILWARAQMADANLKVTLSLRAAKNMFRLGVEESRTPGACNYSVRKVLQCIHSDVVCIWNIKDPNETLVSSTMRSLLQKLFLEPRPSPVTASSRSRSSFVGKGQKAALPADEIISVTVLDQIMNATPAAAKVLISYTLDLTLGLENLYWFLHPRQDKIATKDEIISIFTKYQASEQRIKVQRAVNDFVESEAGETFALENVLWKLNTIAEANRFIPIEGTDD